MKLHSTRALGGKCVGLAAALGGSLALALLPTIAQAQINRSRLPQPAPSGPSATINAPRIYSPGLYNDLYGAPSPFYNNRAGRYGLNNGQQPLDFNSLFSRNSLGARADVRVLYPNPNNSLSAADRLNSRRYLDNSPLHPNPPNQLNDVLYGGRPGGVQNYEPNQLHDVLYGGRAVPPANATKSFDRFNRSLEGYLYRNGLIGRACVHIYYNWSNVYFPDNCACYPYYYETYVPGVTILSPYAYYYGMFPPYIGLNAVAYTPPQYIYVPVPVYNNLGRYQGWRTDDLDDYYLNRDQDESKSKPQGEGDYRIGEEKPKTDPALNKAVEDIRKAWETGDIQMLARHVRRDSRIAVYLRGKYQYSLEAGDYLDMTRDALRTNATLSFTLDRVQRKENGVYAVSGRHAYRSKEGSKRTVYVSFVLEKMDDSYIITQVGTAPDLAQDQ